MARTRRSSPRPTTAPARRKKSVRAWTTAGSGSRAWPGRWSGWTGPAPDNTTGVARRQSPRHASAVPSGPQMVTRRMVVNPPSPRAMVSAASTRRFDRDSPGRHPPQGVRGEPDDRVGPPIRPAAVHDPGGVLPPDRPAAAAGASDLDVQAGAGAGGKVPERVGHGAQERVDNRPGQPVAVRAGAGHGVADLLLVHPELGVFAGDVEPHRGRPARSRPRDRLAGRAEIQ